MAKLGWCQDGHHHACPGSIITFYWVDKKVKRETVQVKVETGERVCDCKHHGPQRKPRRVVNAEIKDDLL